MIRSAAAFAAVLTALLAASPTSAQIRADSLALAPRPMAPLSGLSAF